MSSRNEIPSRENFWNLANYRRLSINDIDINHLATISFGLEIDMSPRFQDWQLIQGVEFDGEIVGIGAYLLVPTDIGLIVYEDLKVVSPSFQGLGIGKRITAKVVRSVCEGKQLVHLLARTQNSGELFSLKGSLALLNSRAQVVPFDVLPNKNDQEILRKYCTVHPAKRGVIDYVSFVHKGAYKTYPDMTVGLNKRKDPNVIDRYLLQNEGSKKCGDAVYLLVPFL